MFWCCVCGFVSTSHRPCELFDLSCFCFASARRKALGQGCKIRFVFVVEFDVISLALRLGLLCIFVLYRELVTAFVAKMYSFYLSRARHICAIVSC